MRNEITAPLHTRALAVLLAFVLAFGLSPISSAVAYGATDGQQEASSSAAEGATSTSEDAASTQTSTFSDETKPNEETTSNQEDSLENEANEPQEATPVSDSTEASAASCLAAESSASAYTDENLATLEANLRARFAKGGSDASLTKGTYAAALALGSLGYANKIDAATLLAAMDAESAPTAGAMGKYLLSLNAAGIDCTTVNDNGTTRNLVSETESLVDASSPSVWDAVCILPALDFASRGTADQSKITAMVDTILAAQNADGLFGDYGYYDSQTTAQAIMALAPHASDASVATAIASAMKALLALQQPDGGFAYTSDDTSSNLDATANIVAALAALGIDASSLTTENGSTPLSYLVAMADDNLAGYTENSSYDEPMTSATVLEGIASYQGYLAKGGAYNIYDASGYPPPKADDQSKDTQDRQTDATSTVAANSTASPATSDTVSPLLLVGLVVIILAAAVALIVISRKNKRR